MKTTKYIIPLVSLMLAPLVSAFTLDFGAVSLGRTIDPALVINVPGYGNVQFAAGFGSALSVENFSAPGGSVKGIEMHNGESLLVTFLGDTPTDVSFDFRAFSVGENVGQVPLSSNTYLLSLSGSTNSLGVSGVNFATAAVPETSTSLLGALGALMLLRRRR